jgi:uncharacterized membrane protein
MSFTSPIALALLLLIPYFVWLGRPHLGTARWRDWASLALRLLIMFLLILSLAGARVVQASDDLAVVFLVDASDSVGPEQAEEAETFVRQAIESMGPADQSAVIVFGSNALVERPMSALAELAPVTSVPQTLHTDIAEAIRLGLAVFPAGSGRRMVLVSDGVATAGLTEEAAGLAASAGVQIDVLALSRPAGEFEATLTRVTAPARVGEGEAFSIEVTAESTADITARLRLLSAGSVVYDEPVQLRPGANNFTIRLQATTQEFSRYVVQIAPERDTYYQNNELGAFTEIVGQPRVLIVSSGDTLDDSGDPVTDESPQLRLALTATGLAVDQITPAELPSSLEELSNYASVVLVNVNAKHLSPRKMAALHSYVRDLGGGLVAVGGPQSYGMGGYFRTPLEDALPVDMQIKDQDRFPSVSIVIVMDRSGSMGVNEGSAAKIQLAAEGAVRVVELLNDFDEITVIPVDTSPDNPIGPALAADREAIIDRIRQIGAGGGGIYVRTGLEAAATALAHSTNQVKHIIVLADGADSEQKEGVPELIGTLRDEGVTVSTVSIGDGPDLAWLQQMAELGGGRFHFTDQAANLPQIFTQETTSIQRSYLIEERFFPSLSNQGFARGHAIFRAMESTGITRVPPLHGYVGTSPKGAAQVILETHLGDPLLAAWEYGLGRSVAWTSDSTGRWGSDWVRWQGFPTFWSSVVRWSISQRGDSSVETAVVLEDDKARLVADARAGDGAYLNNLNMQANIVAPDGALTALSLQQVAPGRYEAEFAPAADGAYFIRIAGTSEEGEVVVGHTAGWVLAYSPEYGHFAPDARLLGLIAERTGGRNLEELDTVEAVEAVLEHDLASRPAARPIWPWLILVAVLLLPADIAVRRLAITRKDMGRAWEASFGRFLPAGAPAARRSERVSRLFQAKERAGTTRPEAPEAISTPIAGQQETSKELGRPEPEASGQRELPAEPVEEPEREEKGTLAARLLDRKRRKGVEPEDGEG